MKPLKRVVHVLPKKTMLLWGKLEVTMDIVSEAHEKLIKEKSDLPAERDALPHPAAILHRNNFGWSFAEIQAKVYKSLR